MAQFLSYLKYSKYVFNELIKKNCYLSDVTLIMGNESCDLDSIISSLSLSFIKFNEQKMIFDNCANVFNNQMPIFVKKLYLPIINLKKCELQLRFDWMYLVKKYNISHEDLCFIDDIELIKNENPKLFELINIILVDHNVLTNSQQYLNSKVIEIIDHHENQTNKWEKPNQKIMKNIRKAGSCTALIAEKIITNKIFFNETELIFSLLTTILVDTFNFDIKLKENRWVDEDYEIFKKLLIIYNENESNKINKDDIFNEISQFKYDENLNLELSLENLMFKDSKAFKYNYGEVIISSIMVSPFSFLKKFGEKEVEEYIFQLINKNKLKFLILMFIYQKEKGKFNRDNIVYAHDHNTLNIIKKTFISDKINFKHLEHHSREKAHFYNDEHNIFSRKLLEPIIGIISFD